MLHVWLPVQVPGGAPQSDSDPTEPPPAALDVVWDIDYIRAVLYRDIVLFYLIFLAAWVVGNLVFLRSRPPVRNRTAVRRHSH